MRYAVVIEKAGDNYPAYVPDLRRYERDLCQTQSGSSGSG